jgi:hypothetical protein
MIKRLYFYSVIVFFICNNNEKKSSFLKKRIESDEKINFTIYFLTDDS